MNRPTRVFIWGLIIFFSGVFSTSMLFSDIISSTGNGWGIYAAIVASLLITLYGFHAVNQSLKSER